MGKHILKEGIIHNGSMAISPYVHTNTIIINKNTKLKYVLDETYNKYHERNCPTWQKIHVVINTTDWVKTSNGYRYIVGNTLKDLSYKNICNLSIDIANYMVLMSDGRFKYIKADTNGTEIAIYCNICPSNTLTLDVYMIYMYNLELERGTPKNLKIKLNKEQFIKLDDYEYSYKINIGELDNGMNYQIFFTFDILNYQKYLMSNNRYIASEYSYGEITLYTEFPFDAEIILILFRY